MLTLWKHIALADGNRAILERVKFVEKFILEGKHKSAETLAASLVEEAQERGLDLAEAVSRRHHAFSLQNLTRFQEAESEFSTAINLHEKAGRVTAATDDRQNKARLYLGWGQFTDDSSKLDLATLEYSIALEFYKAKQDPPDPVGVAACRLGLAELLVETDPQRAKLLAKKALETTGNKNVGPRYLASCHLALAKIAKKLGDTKQFKRHIKELRKFASQAGVSKKEIDYHISTIGEIATKP